MPEMAQTRPNGGQCHSHQRIGPLPTEVCPCFVHNTSVFESRRRPGWTLVLARVGHRAYTRRPGGTNPLRIRASPYASMNGHSPAVTCPSQPSTTTGVPIGAHS